MVWKDDRLKWLLLSVGLFKWTESKNNCSFWLWRSQCKICLNHTVNYTCFWQLIYQKGRRSGGGGDGAFVIKQKKLSHDVNIGDLIETDTGAVENWTVNHWSPARLTVGKTQRDIDRRLIWLVFFFLLCLFTLISYSQNVNTPIVVVVFPTGWRCDSFTF